MKPIRPERSVVTTRAGNRQLQTLVADESAWMSKPDSDGAGVGTRLKMTRWSRKKDTGIFEVSAKEEEVCHMVTFPLRDVQVAFRIGNQEISKTSMSMHRPLLHGPTTSERVGVFGGVYNSIRIHLPQELVRECYETVLGKDAPAKVELFDAHFSEDEVVGKLCHSLVAIADDNGPFGPAVVDAAGLALAARLVALSERVRVPLADRGSPTLANWRLRRVLEYLEENLKKPIYLAELANVAGLSRMHFAAQFRTATGIAPHAYVLKRRVENAKRLLLERGRSIADVSLEMGFSSQAHFSGAFKKMVGSSPGQWRSEALFG